MQIKPTLPFCVAAIAAAITLSVAVSRSHAESITQSEHDKMPQLNISTFKDAAAGLDGKIVSLRFNHRHHGTDLPDGGYECNVGGQVVGLQKDAGHVRVSVPPEGRHWIDAVTTNTTSNQQYVVYGRITKGDDGMIIRCVGTQMHLGLGAGGEITWR